MIIQSRRTSSVQTNFSIKEYRMWECCPETTTVDSFGVFWMLLPRVSFLLYRPR